MHKGTLIALAAILAAAFPRPVGADAAADWQALMHAQKQAAVQAVATPPSAIATLYRLFRERREMDPWVAVAGVSAIVRLQKASGQEETAYQLCDWALGKYGWHPAVARTVADKALLLNAGKRSPEVETLVAQYWPKVTETHWSHANAVVAQWCAALQAQGKDAEQVQALKKALLEIPGILDEGQQSPPGWIYHRITNTLGNKPEREEALRWARVRFLACAFEPAALERSARALARAWKAVEPAGTGIAGLAAAQDGGANPLDAILPVAFDPTLRKAQLAKIQGGAQAAHDRISLYLLAGAKNEALSEALSLLRDLPDLPAGTREVCRVLKAMDGNLCRANAFLAFAKTGAGANLLPDLAAEAGTEAPPPPSPAARAALENSSRLPENLVSAAVLRPGTDTLAPVGDEGLTITVAHLEAIRAAVAGILPPGQDLAPAHARVNVPAAPMPGLDAVAVLTLPAAAPMPGMGVATAAAVPAAVAVPGRAAADIPPQTGGPAPTSAAPVTVTVSVMPPPSAAAGIQKAGAQEYRPVAPAAISPALPAAVPAPREPAATPARAGNAVPTSVAPAAMPVAVVAPAAGPGRAGVPAVQPTSAPPVATSVATARPATAVVSRASAPAAPASARAAAVPANVRQEMAGVAVAGAMVTAPVATSRQQTPEVVQAVPLSTGSLPAPIVGTAVALPAPPATGRPDASVPSVTITGTTGAAQQGALPAAVSLPAAPPERAAAAPVVASASSQTRPGALSAAVPISAAMPTTANQVPALADLAVAMRDVPPPSLPALTLRAVDALAPAAPAPTATVQVFRAGAGPGLALLPLEVTQRPADAATAPPTVAAVTPVASPTSSAAPARVHQASVEATAGSRSTPAAVSASAISTTVVLAQIAAGTVSGEQAWQSGGLTADDLKRALETAPLQWEDPYCTALAGMLAKHYPDDVRDTATLDTRVRLWLAVYYRSQKDERAVPLYESLLADKQQSEYVIECAICGLAAYYKTVGDYKHAAQTWMRAQQLSQSSMLRANSLVDAARLYKRMGDEQTAADLYAKVPQYGYGWATGVALLDQASGLLSRGEHERARELLQRPVEGRYADQIRVALLDLLGSSYYRTGDLASAERVSQETIALYRSVADPLRGADDLSHHMVSSERRLRWIAFWKQTPFYGDRARVRLLPTSAGSVASETFTIRCYREVDLSADPSALGDRVTVADRWSGGDPNYYERRITVAAASPTSVRRGESWVTIRSPQFPGLELRVPLETGDGGTDTGT